MPGQLLAALREADDWDSDGEQIVFPDYSVGVAPRKPCHESIRPSLYEDVFEDFDTDSDGSSDTFSDSSTDTSVESRDNSLLSFLTTPSKDDDSFNDIVALGHIDYLSHQWTQDDFWSSWKSIARSPQEELPSRVRLVNAMERSWAKSLHALPTTAPEELEWKKDSDITWLYGPLYQKIRPRSKSHSTPAPRRVSESNAEDPATHYAAPPLLKSILRQRTSHESMLLQLQLRPSSPSSPSSTAQMKQKKQKKKQKTVSIRIEV